MIRSVAGYFKNPTNTAAGHAALNVTVPLNVMFVESDTKAIKVGDGITPWNSLPYFINPTDHVSINSKTTGSAITVVSPNASNGPSDTEGFIRATTASGNDGWYHRWNATDGNYVFGRKVAGVETTMMTFPKTGGQIAFGSTGNETFRVLAGTGNINNIRVAGSPTNGGPVLIQALSSVSTNVPLHIRVLGTSDFSVVSQDSARTQFRVASSPSNSNFIIVNPSPNGAAVSHVATGLTDINVGHNFNNTGEGPFKFFGGYPSSYPIAVFTPFNAGTCYLDVYNGGNNLTIGASPVNVSDSTNIYLEPSGANGGVRLNGFLGLYGATPIAKQTVSGAFTDLNSLKNIVYALGTAFANLGAINFTAT